MAAKAIVGLIAAVALLVAVRSASADAPDPEPTPSPPDPDPDPQPEPEPEPDPGPVEFIAVFRNFFGPNGRFVILVPSDVTITVGIQNRIRERINRSVGYIEHEANVVMPIQLEPAFFSAPWTRGEMRAEVEKPDGLEVDWWWSEIKRRGLDVNSHFVMVIAIGAGGWAGSFIDGLGGGAPPFAIVGDCVYNAWTEDLTGDFNDCHDLLADQNFPAVASTLLGQTGAFAHELFHLVGHWPSHTPGTLMDRWWDYPDTETAGLTPTQTAELII